MDWGGGGLHVLPEFYGISNECVQCVGVEVKGTRRDLLCSTFVRVQETGAIKGEGRNWGGKVLLTGSGKFRPAHPPPHPSLSGPLYFHVN